MHLREPPLPLAHFSINGRTSCRNMAFGIERSGYASRLCCKFLHLSEFYLLCKAGTVTALPRRAGGGTKGNRACKGSPGAITPQKQSAVISRPLVPSLSVFPVRSSAPAGTMSFLSLYSQRLTQWSLNGSLLQNRSKIAGRPAELSTLPGPVCVFTSLTGLGRVCLIPLAPGHHGSQPRGGRGGSRCGECTKGGIISLKDSN